MEAEIKVPSPPATIKEISEVIGNFGKWQAGIFFIAFVVKLLGPFLNLSGVFLLPKVPFWCSDVNQSAFGDSIAWNASRKELNSCQVSIKDSINQSHTFICNSWEYDHTVFKSTLTEKFNLVCSQSWLISLSSSMFMVGFLAACVVLGYFSDKFGRRPAAVIGVASLVVADGLVLYSPNFIVYIIAQFFIGFGRTGILNSSYIILLEVVGVEHRSAVGTAVALGFNIGYMIFPGVAYLLKDWFYIHLTTTGIVVFLLAIVWFLPESPRWLLLNNKLDAAEKIVVQAAKINGKKIVNSESVVEQLARNFEKEKESTKELNAFRLLKTPNMREKTFILFYLWFVSSFVYYGLSYNVQDIGGNLFLNFFIFGAAEVPGTIFAILGQRYLGRKKTFIIVMASSAVACIGIVFLTSDLLWLRITLATIGKAMIQAAFESVYVHTVEIFPTKFRSIGLTSCSVAARVGSIMAPFMKELGEGNDFIVPMCLFGGFAASSALITIFLPETRNRPLPETLEQAEGIPTTKFTLCPVRKQKKEDHVVPSDAKI